MKSEGINDDGVGGRRGKTGLLAGRSRCPLCTAGRWSIQQRIDEAATQRSEFSPKLLITPSPAERILGHPTMGTRHLCFSATGSLETGGSTPPQHTGRPPTPVRERARITGKVSPLGTPGTHLESPRGCTEASHQDLPPLLAQQRFRQFSLTLRR